jgi:hypothetical protein
MVVDVKHDLASLDGAQLEVVATRLTDGAFARRTYRFPPPADRLRAGTTTSDHGQ